MGFLDRMVADLIADSTGLPVRRIVRRVGARNLLLLGGAALAGGALVHAASRSGAGRPTAPPPPPPAGAPSTPPPPPPPPPSAGTPVPQAPAATSTGASPPPPPEVGAPAVDAPEAALPPDLAFAIVRAMVGAALADGRLSDEERRAIHGHLDGSELTPDQVAQVHRDLVVPPSPEDIAGSVRDDSHRAVIYRAAVLVAHADRDASDPENAWLERLGAALGLGPDDRSAIVRDLAGLA